MNEWIFIAIAFFMGAVIAWFAGSWRAKTLVSAALREQETRATAAEARVEEMRQQVATAREDFERLREKLSLAEMAKVSAETNRADMETNLKEQKALLEDAKAKLSDVFKALAADALAKNNTGFLTLAEEKFRNLKEGVEAELETRKIAIESLVQPLSQTLDAYQKESKDLEDKRIRELSMVGEQLRSLAVAQIALQTETRNLVNALRSPHIRGRWGEIALRKTAELAGMSSHCDFVEQESATTETGRLRPDMIVKLPAGREVVVDSKAPLEGFLEALEAKSDEERERALQKHASQVNQHVNKLASKEYWDQFGPTPEFVVLFIPNDTFLAAAAEKDPTLIEAALAKKVVISTPTTFIALLRAIAFGWRHEQVAENAQRISALGQELSDRMATLAEHLLKVGASLGKSVDSYNSAVASFESRVFSSARKFKSLGVGGKKDIEELQPIDQIPRALNLISEPSDVKDGSVNEGPK